MAGKKKVLCFMPGSVGGAERMVVTVGKMLSAAGFDVKYVIVGTKHGIEDFIPEDIAILRIPIRKIYHFGISRIANVIRKEKPDSVFSSVMYLNCVVLLAARFSGTRCIVRNDNGLSLSSRLLFLGMFLTYRMADMVIAQQQEMREEILCKLKLPSEKVVTVHNPLDTDLIESKLKVLSPYKNDDEVRFINVARFDTAKAQDILVRAFYLLRSKIQNAHLYLIGNYDKEEETYVKVSDFVKENKMEDYVHIIGFDKNPYRWEKNAHCFVLSSRIEGLPNALIEAMYLGLPVVSTTCIPAISRIVENGRNGYLVSVDDVNAMALAMEKALKLKNIEMTYHPSTAEDVVSLFDCK